MVLELGDEVIQARIGSGGALDCALGSTGLGRDRFGACRVEDEVIREEEDKGDDNLGDESGG